MCVALVRLCGKVKVRGQFNFLLHLPTYKPKNVFNMKTEQLSQKIPAPASQIFCPGKKVAGYCLYLMVSARHIHQGAISRKKKKKRVIKILSQE